MRSWNALDFEAAAAERGLVATALRSFDEWDATPQGRAVAAQPLFTIERIGDAPPLRAAAAARERAAARRVRVLDLTRILAGPVGGRALAAYGADVMLVNSPHLPNIEAIADTSRGKLSAHVDLRSDGGRDALRRLVGDAHVFVQGYRPGGLAALGFGARAMAARRPGIVYVSLTPMARRARGRSAAASIRWCRRRWASTMPRARRPATASRGRCRCRSSTRRPAT